MQGMTRHTHAKSFAGYTGHLIPGSKNDDLHVFKPTSSSTSKLCVHAHSQTFAVHVHNSHHT